MAKEFSRTLRLGEQIRRDLAELLLREVKDPRLSLVTISDIEVANDLSVCKVFYTVLGSEFTDEVQGALERSAGFLRSKLGKRIQCRRTPELRFTYDPTEETADVLERLIMRARLRDKVSGQDDS